MVRKIRNVIETLVAELRNKNYYSIAQQMRDSDSHSETLENLIDEYSADNNALNAELDSLRDEIESLRDELANANEFHSDDFV
jgi:predicted RNase H-like nuclease (RuvC/YqgF family)